MKFQFVSRAAVGNSGVVKKKSERSWRIIQRGFSHGHVGLKFEAGGLMASIDGGSMAVVCDSGGGSLIASDSSLSGSISSDGVGSVVVVCESKEAAVVCSLDGQGASGKLKRWKRLARDKAVGMSEVQQSLGKRMGQEIVGDVIDRKKGRERFELTTSTSLGKEM
ncbi:hypothetical protein ACOSQ3_014913 [Xanthoceras sorbifolium]